MNADQMIAEDFHDLHQLAKAVQTYFRWKVKSDWGWGDYRDFKDDPEALADWRAEWDMARFLVAAGYSCPALRKLERGLPREMRTIRREKS